MRIEFKIESEREAIELLNFAIHEIDKIKAMFDLNPISI